MLRHSRILPKPARYRPSLSVYYAQRETHSMGFSNAYHLKRRASRSVAHNNLTDMSSYGDMRRDLNPETLNQQYLSQTADSFMDARCLLDIDSKPQVFRGTKIICTIGPASRSVEVLKEMITAGMDVARLNFSHGDHDYHRQTIANIRTAIESFRAEPLGFKPVAIALDTKGPEIRTGLIRSDIKGDLSLKRGQSIRLSMNPEHLNQCSTEMIYVDYTNLPLIIQNGNRIYIDDGLICLRATAFGEDWVDCEVENAGLLGSKKGVNLPGLEVDLPAISVKDKADLTFGVEQGVDMVFASFVRKAADVREIREHLGTAGENIRIISKVENHEGVRKIDEVINESDGVMVARGDMGIEIPAQKVFLAQKMIIARCNVVGKPVICATQMLESMVSAPRPTRAEVSDVANAVIDGSDCIMLSGETAKGEYPVDSVRMQHVIAREAEPAIYHRQLFEDLRKTTGVTNNTAETVAIAVVEAALKCRASGIIVLTTSGISAQLVSKYRPQCPIFAVSRKEQTARQCQIFRGIIPVNFQDQTVSEPWSADVEKRVNFGIEVGKHKQLLESGNFVVVVTGWRPGSGATNTMRIMTVE